MASYTIIPDSTYSTGESTSSTFTVPAGEATVKCTVGVFTMGNDADVLTVWYEQSTDGVTWQPKGTFQFQRAVRGGGGGSGAWMQQEQFYYPSQRQRNHACQWFRNHIDRDPRSRQYSGRGCGHLRANLAHHVQLHYRHSCQL
jgi:hypothetical protein